MTVPDPAAAGSSTTGAGGGSVPDPDDAGLGAPGAPGAPDGPGGSGDPRGAVRLTAWVRGRVQGVGFRWWTRCRALELGLTGRATNLDDGRVEVVAEGPRDACERLLAALRGGGTPGRVVSVTERWGDPKGGMTGFVER